MYREAVVRLRMCGALLPLAIRLHGTVTKHSDKFPSRQLFTRDVEVSCLPVKHAEAEQFKLSLKKLFPIYFRTFNDVVSSS
jgi:hypothetical protein